jgi:hypothetical protein
MSFVDLLYGASLVLWFPLLIGASLWFDLIEPATRSPRPDVVEPKELQDQRSENADD